MDGVKIENQIACFDGGRRIGLLELLPVSDKRRHRTWRGEIDGESVDLPNLRSVGKWARERGYYYRSPFEP